MRRLAVLLFSARCSARRLCRGAQFVGAASRRHHRAGAPSNLPKPTPGMDPDVLLREFLKATADPGEPAPGGAAVPHQSASDAWDDAGSALLIDHVVFVETRSAERVSVTMRADMLGRCRHGGFRDS